MSTNVGLNLKSNLHLNVNTSAGCTPGYVEQCAYVGYALALLENILNRIWIVSMKRAFCNLFEMEYLFRHSLVIAFFVASFST